MSWFDISIRAVTAIISFGALVLSYVSYKKQRKINDRQSIINDEQREFNNRQKERENDCGKIEKALEMAKYYEEEILTDLSLISAIINHYPPISALTNRVAIERAKLFNADESKLFFSEGERNQLEAFFMRSDGVDIAVIRPLFDLYGRPFSAAPVLDEVKVKFEMSKLIIRFLNKLEYFSMAFHQKVADDDVVYQSLHQTFIKIMKLLYFPIAYHNTEAYDRMFTNAIILFNAWRERLINEQAKQQKAKEQLEPVPPQKIS